MSTTSPIQTPRKPLRLWPGVIAVVLTILILLLVLGSLTSAFVPVGLSLTAVLASMGLTAAVSSIVPMDASVNEVILLVGLAVGVDYSMFYLRRKMEERDAGRSNEAALEFAAATSGQAVLISGVTVLIAMAGMLIAGNAVFTSMAVGTMLVVAVAVLGSVTVLPAVLSKLGDKVEKGRVLIGNRFSMDSDLRRFSPRDPGEHLDGLWEYLYPSRPSTGGGGPNQ